MFDAATFSRRREELLAALPVGSVTLLFSGRAPYMSGDHPYHPFHVNRNFFYLTGIDQENSALVMAKLDSGVKTTLFTEHVDPIEEKWTGTRLRDEESTAISDITTIEDIAALEKSLGRLLGDGLYDTLYLDMEQDTWGQTETTAHPFARTFQTKYPTMQLRNPYALICSQRTIKDAQEIAAISEAIRITKDGIENMMTHAKPGMKEYEVEAHFNYSLRSQGVKEHAFPSIIAGGGRATVLHYVDNDKTLEDGDLVLCDLGAAWQNYSADITRTFPVNGKFSARQRTFYEIVLKAMDETMAAIRPGVKTSELNDVTKATLARELKSIGLIQSDDELSRYYYHGVSHRLGLDTHDVGSTDVPLKPGDVITVEPGLYVAEEGIGIRIEDDVVVTDNGYVNLSKDIIKRVDEIEAFFANRG